MSATPWPCPWCGRSGNRRALTIGEELRRAPLNFIHSAISGAYNLAFNPKVFIDALMTPTVDTRCDACSKIVQACPNCDRPYRWINAGSLQCLNCSTAFM
jgi:hypothetical protein